MAEKFFKEKHPKDIDELINILSDHQDDAATMQALADASRIGAFNHSKIVRDSD
jgi:hypothetical protein